MLRVFWAVVHLATIAVAGLIYKSIQTKKSSGDRAYQKVVSVKKKPSFSDPQPQGLCESEYFLF